MENDQHKLLEWYDLNHRSLPWRDTSNPYYIWLSEIILQQTRVDQGLPYYIHFTETYPTVKDLANANEDQILKSWEGLGYYSRARNLHAAAKYVSKDLKGIFPNNYKDILKLKGVGPYTGAAIASFAFKEKIAVLDGNVFRVLSRYFSCDTPIDSTLGKKEFTQLANEFLNQRVPDKHNQAIMELGALICSPRSPKCNECPLNEGCQSAYSNKWEELPVKSKKTKVKDLYMDFFVYRNKDQVLIEKRSDSGIWKNLYQFPVEESFSSFNGNIKKETGYLKSSALFEHQLSHRSIKAHFHLIESTIKKKKHQTWVPIEKLDDYAFPKLILKYLIENQF